MAITKRRKEYLLQKKDDTERRLELYRFKEEEILNGAAQMYTIGGRSLQRYQLSLNQITTTIKNLEDELREIDDELAGAKRRRSVGVIPCDW